MKLLLGSSKEKRPGWVCLDKFNYGQQFVRDLEKGLPMIKSNSVDFIEIRHTLEHLWNGEFLMLEMNRVLKVGGRVEITVPHYSNHLAYVFSHKRFFSWIAFHNDWLSKWDFMSREVGAWKLICSEIRFAQPGTSFPPFRFFEWLFNLNDFARFIYDKVLCHWMPCYEIYFLLEKREHEE